MALSGVEIPLDAHGCQVDASLVQREEERPDPTSSVYYDPSSRLSNNAAHSEESFCLVFGFVYSTNSTYSASLGDHVAS
jgi:hypothetical protein